MLFVKVSLNIASPMILPYAPPRAVLRFHLLGRNPHHLTSHFQNLNSSNCFQV